MAKRKLLIEVHCKKDNAKCIGDADDKGLCDILFSSNEFVSGHARVFLITSIMKGRCAHNIVLKPIVEEE